MKDTCNFIVLLKNVRISLLKSSLEVGMLKIHSHAHKCFKVFQLV